MPNKAKGGTMSTSSPICSQRLCLFTKSYMVYSKIQGLCGCREYARTAFHADALRSAAHQNEKGERAFAFHGLAEWTGLEPATPGVTGRYSNQLNYHSRFFSGVPLDRKCVISRSRPRPGGWWVLRGSNPRLSPCKGDALPAELSTRKVDKFTL